MAGEGMRDEVDVAVIGGGAAGIAAARRLLREPGLSVLLIEAGDRLGGRAHTLPGALPGRPRMRLAAQRAHQRLDGDR